MAICFFLDYKISLFFLFSQNFILIKTLTNGIKKPSQFNYFLFQLLDIPLIFMEKTFPFSQLLLLLNETFLTIRGEYQDVTI